MTIKDDMPYQTNKQTSAVPISPNKANFTSILFFVYREMRERDDKLLVTFFDFENQSKTCHCFEDHKMVGK